MWGFICMYTYDDVLFKPDGKRFWYARQLACRSINPMYIELSNKISLDP